MNLDPILRLRKSVKKHRIIRSPKLRYDHIRPRRQEEG